MQDAGKWILAHFAFLGGLGLFFFSIVDSGPVPVPPQGVDLLLFAAVVRSPGDAWSLAALATLGAVGGATILYWVSRRGGEALLERRISHERAARVRNIFERYEVFTILVPAMAPLPLPMKLFVIAAGALRVKFSRFLVANFIGRLVRFFGIAALAARYGNLAWQVVQHHLLAVVLGFLALLGFVYWFSHHWVLRHL